ncbi:major capsid-like protein [Paracoccus phage Shpa]|uniref:Major capsid-like protein n=1 Tax=Paracoccus phage Shpa TaxID=1647282 RepID=A0A0U2C0U7_9CAUD|nr:major capsid-like protein [Paracoccus phage Shpa]AKG94517.1 major capsid-like protein [Paracoccus phage Shpa]
MSETKTAEQLAAETKAAFDKSLDAVKGIAEEALGKAAKGEELAASLKEKADEALTGLNGLKALVAEVEQKLARGASQEEVEQSLGEKFANSDEFKSFAASGFDRSAKAALRLKATLTTATTNAAGSVGDGVQATRLPGVIDVPQRRMTIRDLITPGRMDGNTIEYVIETGDPAAGAGMVAEGAVKPEVDLGLDIRTISAKVIAANVKASRQALDDVSFLRSMIDQRLLYKLAYREEVQLLSGDNTGQNLHGIIPQATAFNAAFTPTAASPIDRLRLSILQVALAEYPASGFVLHPTDWAKIELTKDGENRYIIGNPQGTIAPSLWGLPVVATQAIAENTFLTGAFRLGAQLFDRWDAAIQTGYVNDDFTRNLVTILAEQRLALAVYRPAAFVTGQVTPSGG